MLQAGSEALSEHGDFLVTFSTVPGTLSYVNDETGSWFIRELVSVFGDGYKTKHVTEMINEVTGKVTGNRTELKAIKRADWKTGRITGECLQTTEKVQTGFYRKFYFEPQ